jgi:undecaprenyl-diphosphatase
MTEKKYNLILSLVSLFIFMGILIIIFFGKNYLDFSINNSIWQIQNFYANLFFIFLGKYSETIMIILALFFIALLYLKKEKLHSLILSLSLMTGYLIKEIIKLMVQRERPLNQLVQETGYSFPSGSATISMILFSMLIYFYKDKIKNKKLKFLFIGFNLFLILLFGFSRIYLNAHWFTDVVGGYALGFFLFNLYILFLK